MRDTVHNDTALHALQHQSATATPPSDAELIRDLLSRSETVETPPQSVEKVAPAPAGKTKHPRKKRRLDFSYLKRFATPRTLALSAALLACLVAPATTALTILALTCGLIVVVFAIGPQRSARLCGYAYAKLAQRSPDKAERLRACAERGVSNIARLTDRLPASWTEDLYLPDLSPKARGKEDIALERLRRMAEEN